MSSGVYYSSSLLSNRLTPNLVHKLKRLLHIGHESIYFIYAKKTSIKKRKTVNFIGTRNKKSFWGRSSSVYEDIKQEVITKKSYNLTVFFFVGSFREDLKDKRRISC